MIFRRIAVLAFTLLVFGTQGTSQEVDRKQPAIFKEKLEALLTPLEEVLENSSDKFLDDESGAVLIQERIDFVGDDGKFYRVARQVNRANTQAGADAMEREIFGFSTSEERITLIEARTIQPDGKKDPVRNNAALIQDTGDAGNGIYQDRSELIVIFPNVRPKSITESIFLVTREEGFRIPDEFMTILPWKQNIWPLVKRKMTLEAPNSQADRFNVTRLGTGVPEFKKENVEDSRTRFLWTVENLDRRPFLQNRPPARQSGPATFLTSWETWDDLAVWYAGLLEGRGDLPDELKSKLAGWTKDLTTEEEIIETLYSKVANDVRYVGLEFGLSGLQPYACGDVWKNGYGDCKDKSNLLRALLVEKGIEAHLALVDTEHGGDVEKRSPSYQPFNHAILAVKDPKSDTGWRLMDPTISRAPAGTLGQWVADRDILILKGDKAVWTRSPKSTAGEIEYDFKLDIESAGSLSGWLELKTKGFMAASVADDYANRGREAALYSAQNLVVNFFPRAEVIDLEYDEIKTTHEEFTLRAYFVTPFPFPQNANEAVPFSFPDSRTVLPYLGEKSKRNAAWFQWKDLTRLNFDVGMPDGWKVGKMPDPIALESDAVEAKGNWKTDDTGTRLTGSFEIIQKESTIAGAKFASTFNAVNSMANWLKRPAQFIPGDAAAAPGNNNPRMTVKLPVMPTGEGQLALVEARYPVEAGVDERRAALQQTMQYFPDDPETQFAARSQLAYLEYIEKRYAKAVKDMDSIFADLGKKASIEQRGWARFIRSLALLEIEERRKEGVDDLVKLAGNLQMDEYRRTYSALNAAVALEEESPEQAAKVIEPLLKAEVAEVVPALYGFYASIMVDLGKSDELLKHLETTLNDGHPLASLIFTQLANVAKTALFEVDDKKEPTPDKTEGKPLHELLAGLNLAALVDNDPELERALKDLNSSLDSQKSLGGLREKLVALLKADDAPDFMKKGAAPEDHESVEEFEFYLEELRENGQHPQFLTAVTTYFEKYQPTENFSYFIWKLLAYSEFYERPAPGADPPTKEDDKKDFFPKVLEIANALPTTDSNYLECKFTEGRWLEFRQRYREAAQLYETLLKHPDFDSDFSVSATTRAGEAWEKVGEFEKAEASYLQSKHEANNVAEAVDGMLRAAVIRLETGRDKEAIELFDEMRQLDPSTIQAAAFVDVISWFLKLTEDPEKAQAYWKHTASWWPKWRDLCHGLPGIDETMTDRTVVGLIADGESYQYDFSQGVTTKNGPQFLQSYEVAAHAARWVPDMTAELARLTIYGASRLKPASAPEFRAFVANIYENVTPVDEEDTASFYLFETVALADEQPEKAVKVAKSYFADHPDNHDDLEVAIARVWAVSAIAAKDATAKAEAAAMLDSQLQSTTPIGEREITISTLADLYRSEGNVAAETALLKRELTNPAVRTNENFSRALSSRLSALADASQDGERLTAAIRSWIDTNNLPWLEASEPLTLKDRRLRNLEETVNRGSSGLDDFGNIKMWLLAAEKSDLSVQVRWSAFQEAVAMLVDLEPNRDRKFDLYASALELDLPARFLNYFAYISTAQFSEYPNREKYLHFRNHPAGKTLWDRNDKRLLLFDAVSEAPASDPEARLAAVEKITADDVSSLGLSVLSSIHLQLLEYCFYDAADELRDSVSDWNLDNTVDQTPLTLKLSFMKVQKQVTESRERNEAIRQLIVDKVGFDDLKEGDQTPYLYSVSGLPSKISLDDTHRILLQAVKDGRVGLWGATEWYEVCDKLPYSPEMMDLRFELLNTYLDMTDDDLERSLGILFVTSFIDTDEAANRDRLEKDVFPKWEAKRTEAPLTWDTIRNFRIRMAIRTGDQSINPEKEMAGINHPFLQNSKVSTVLEYALARKDKPLIDRIVNNLDVEDLVSDRMLALTLPALEILEREAELELVREEAMGIRNRSAIEAWATGDMGAASVTLELSELLHEQESLPKGWFEGTLSQLKQERHRLSLLADEAMLREDWKTAIKHSSAAIEKFPTYYHFYGLLGRSAYKEGEFDKARDPLKTFIKYENDSLHHEEAKSMLEEIEKK